jgi:hypothetical protein
MYFLWFNIVINTKINKNRLEWFSEKEESKGMEVGRQKTEEKRRKHSHRFPQDLNES